MSGIANTDRREGFWHSAGEPWLPIPMAYNLPWAGREVFLKCLVEVEQRATETRYRGLSECRMCRRMCGCSEYQLSGWRWPAGFRHYIDVHGVRPSLAFEEFVVGACGHKIEEKSAS